MAFTATWVGRNGELQQDLLVDHFAAGVTPTSDWRVVCEWRYRAGTGDAWGAPTINTVAPPLYQDSYTPPGDGYVQLTIYAIEDGRVSWQGYIAEMPAAGGEPATPQAYVDEAEAGYVDETSNAYVDR